MKNFLMIVLKNAINVIIVTGVPLIWDSGHFNFSTWPAFLNTLRLVGGAIVAREAVVWGPILLKWTNTDADPNT